MIGLSKSLRQTVYCKCPLLYPGNCFIYLCLPAWNFGKEFQDSKKKFDWFDLSVYYDLSSVQIQTCIIQIWIMNFCSNQDRDIWSQMFYLPFKTVFVFIGGQHGAK